MAASPTSWFDNSNLDSSDPRGPKQQDPVEREWYLDGRRPLDFGGKGADEVELGLADEQSETALVLCEANRERERSVEAFNGPEGDDICLGVGKVFATAGEHIDVRQCKCAGDFAEKDSLSLVRFDQRQTDMRSPDLYGQTGEAGARTEVYEMKAESRVAGQAWPLPHATFGKKWRAAKIDSPKWRVTISSG